jgi:hypothetical protein
MGIVRGRLAGRARAVSTVVCVTAIALGSAIAHAPLASAAGDVKKTMNVNSNALKVTTKTAGQRMLVTFQGVAGEVVTVATASGTFSTNCNANLTLDDPTTAQVAGPACAGQAGSLSGVTLPATGLYVAVLTPVGSAVGTVQFTITATSGPLSITPLGAPPEVVQIPANGTVDLSFNAAKNKWLTAQAKTSSYAHACDLQLSIIRPNNSILEGPNCVGSGTTFWDRPPAALPQTGVYKARLTSIVGTAGTAQLQVWTFADKKGSITPDGASVAVSLTVPGQQAAYSFSVTAGDVGKGFTADLTGATFATYYVGLVRPDASIVYQTGFAPGASFYGPNALDQSGTWKILIDPANANTGKVTVAAHFVTGSGSTITIDGPAVTATISSAGSTADFTFSGTTGDRLFTTLTGASFSPNGQYFVSFIRPDTSVFASTGEGNGDSYIDPDSFSTPLDATGTWTIEIDPVFNDTGSVQVQINSAPDVTGSITVGTATSPPITTTKAGQNASYSITPNLVSGNRISITLTGATFADSYYVTLVHPDGTSFYSVGEGAGDSFIDPDTLGALDQNGTAGSPWRLTINPIGPDTGSVTVLIKTVIDIHNPITVDASTKTTVSINQAGKNAYYTFSATSGQRVAITLTSATFAPNGFYYATLIRPDGTPFYNAGEATGDGFVDPDFYPAGSFDQSGTWQIEINPNGTDTGSVKVQLTSAPDLTGSITVGAAATTITTTKPGQNALYTITPDLSSGQRLAVTLTSATFADSYYVTLVHPDGTSFYSVGEGVGDSFIDPDTVGPLDQTGTWKIQINPIGADIGSVNVRVDAVTDIQGGALTFGTAKLVTIAQSGQNAYYTFDGSNGQNVTATLSNALFSPGGTYWVQIYRPDGSGYSTNALTNGGSTIGPFALDQSSDATHKWTIEINPLGTDTGSVKVKLT